MGAAEGISFEEVRARKPWSPLRHQLHERFDPWLDTLEQAWHEPPSTFPEVTATVWALRPQRTGGITATMVTQAHEGAHQRTQTRGPPCPRGLKVQEHVWRTVETRGGPVALERPSVYCRACRVGLSPLDDALGLVAGCQQLERPQAAAPVVTAVPYETAQALCGARTGRHCGSARLHTVTNQVAEGLTVLDVAPSRQESARRLASVAAGRCRRPVVVLGLDGASVPPRPDSARQPCEGRRGTRAPRARWRGPWRDAKGLRFSLLDGERLVPGRSWHQIQHEEHLGAALTQLTEAGVMPEAQVRLGVVCDGAAWIWQHVQALGPQARQVLDDDHCAQDLPRVAKAHDGASVQAVEWVEATMTRLSLGKAGVVLAGRKRMRPTSDEAAKAMANCWDYLKAHRGRTVYRTLRRGGSPLGSGGIASSNKCMGQVRLKRSGAWGYEANSNHMFALRCAKYNGTLDQVFVRYQQRLRETSE